MFKKSYLSLAVAAAMVMPSLASAEIETSVTLKNETAVFIKDGMRTGEATSMLDTAGEGREFYKSETSARIFFNGDIGEESTWHGELKIIGDPLAEDDYRWHENYTQHDWFRELYVDTNAAGWDFRIGKQQQVWGTADGIKLLDIINPTDFRELNQNAMEDSRIPVWMIAGERYLDAGGNVQLIVAQPEENKIPGLNPNGDSGHPFIMKGVDSITGEVNGFYNVTPALSNVAGSFNNAAAAGMFGSPAPGLLPFAGMTVDGFASNPDPLGSGTPGDVLLNSIAQFGLAPGDPNANMYITNLMDIDGPLPTDFTWNPVNPKSAFEYMPNATFTTFNTFTQWTGTPGASPTTGIGTQWVRDYENSPNLGGRFRHSLDNGLNYSVNYFYHYSANPAIDLSWRDPDPARGNEKLNIQRAPATPIGGGAFAPDLSQNLSRDEALASVRAGVPVTVLATNSSGQYYGAWDPMTFAPNANTNPATLQFREYSDRVHSIGGSFDYAMEMGDLPLVLRGEFLYDKDEKQPVVDRFLLSIGDLANALTMEEADYFKYVLGADVTVLTNMLASFQFIQFRNLDYVDQPCDPITTQGGNLVSCDRYTADFATLHLSNGLNKAEKNKEFYSFFLSKPFGEADLGRWNNIIIYEEGGGYWDRFDVEYSLTDQLIVSGEVNLYWGDENTTFGQFKNSSNAQIGVKWIME